MGRLLLCLTFGLLAHAPAWAQGGRDAVEISVKHAGDKDELLTRDQLQRLLRQHDLSKWLFTKKVVIDRDEGIPHSHPVLTLNTRYTKDDELLLATFVHEQLHWLLEQKSEQARKAMAELRGLFPDAPSGPPEGARDQESTYRHLIVCHLEYQAVRELLGELRGRQVIEFWATHHYRWVYRQVLEEGRRIGGVVRKHGLSI
ncbi:MAG TPA: hypothetical protein VG148_12110 [Pyrinomonadaceae bacterium]|nr:hypothetical protein [Pyrinomonadaceae bacterium]